MGWDSLPSWVSPESAALLVEYLDKESEGGTKPLPATLIHRTLVELELVDGGPGGQEDFDIEFEMFSYDITGPRTTAQDNPKLKSSLVKIADPVAGPTRQEYEDMCKALGVEPSPPKPED